MDQPQRQHRADPHRRLQRHTYQEGPDFLFLATRGGRPPKSTRRPDLSALRFRARCVRSAAALALGVSRASLHCSRATLAGEFAMRLAAWRLAHRADGVL